MSMVRSGVLAGAFVLAVAGGAVLGAQGVPGVPLSTFAAHARTAALGACAATYDALGQDLTAGATYAVQTAWNNKAPDAHTVHGLVGLAYRGENYTGPAAGMVIAAPVAQGCEGRSIRIVPMDQSCTKIAGTLEGAKHTGTLSGTPLYRLADGKGQVMLLRAQSGCVAISISGD